MPKPVVDLRRAAPPPPVLPDDLHELVAFEDPEEERTWEFDVTFLLSPWTCIFGRGCQGVLTGPASELVQGCCSYGAHFTDEADVARVEAAAATLTAEQWQFRKKGRKGIIKRDHKTGVITSRLADDACIFLNRPGFPNGPGCALHQAAIERGERPLDLKPNVCWQLPLRREDLSHDDGHVTSRIAQWDRRHWGEGGIEFHWWCTESPDAFVGEAPVYVSMRDELIELVGAPVYAMLEPYLEERRRRGKRSMLPHPAIRGRAKG